MCNSYPTAIVLRLLTELEEGIVKKLERSVEIGDSMNAGKSSQLRRHGFGSLDNFT